MPTEAAGRIDFRRLTADDLPTVAGWLARPHVARWWGDPADAARKIADHIGSPTVAPYIVSIDDAPLGYIQSYDIHAESDHPYRDQPEGAIGIDEFIGEAGMVGKGHGPRLIAAFTDRLFADGAPRVVTDPNPDNAAAIRACEKAGFRAVGRRSSIYGPALLMARDRDAAIPEPAGAAR